MPDRAQFWELLRVSLVQEWRQQWSGDRKKKPHIPILVQSLLIYFIMGLTLSASIVTRVTPPLYTLLCYAYFMMMAALTVILECSQILILPDDLDVLSHRPISSATFFLARITHLMIFILIFSLALCLGPTLTSLFLPGTSRSFVFAFLWMAVSAVIFTALITLFFYALLLRWIRFEKLKSIVMVIQVLFTMTLIFVYQFIARTGWENSTLTFQIRESWLRYSPPGWFAIITESRYLKDAPDRFWVFLLVAVISVLLLFLLFRYLSRHYLTDVACQEMASPLPKPAKKSINGPSRQEKGFLAALIRNPEIRAGFSLTLQLIRRDRSVQIVLLPMLAMPLVILVWGMIEGDIRDPFSLALFGGGTNSMHLLPFFIAFLIYMTLKGCVYIRDWEARWIFYSAPIISPAQFWRGVRAGLFTGIVLPFYLMLLLIFSFHFCVLHALQHTFYLFLLGMIFMSLLSMGRQKLPFSRKRERGERIGGLTFLFVLIPFQVVAVLIQWLTYRTQGTWLISAGSLFCIWLVLDFWGGRRIQVETSGSENLNDRHK